MLGISLVAVLENIPSGISYVNRKNVRGVMFIAMDANRLLDVKCRDRTVRRRGQYRTMRC